MRTRLLLSATAALDLLLGLLLLLWPGLWQELLHPDAMGTTFYPLQRLGVMWLARALFQGLATRHLRARHLAAVAMLWAVDIPGDLLLAWRTADTGPFTTYAYLGHAAIAGLVAAYLWRRSAQSS